MDLQNILLQIKIIWHLLRLSNITFKKVIQDIHVSSYDKPFMKRERLAVNCIDDPPSLFAPFTVQGKILLRQLNFENTDWDTQLPKEKQQK